MNLSEETITAIKRGLLSCIDPVEILIFGSHATDHTHSDSDIDICAIISSKKISRKDIIRCRIAIRELMGENSYPFDLIVESEENFDQEKEKIGTIQRSIDQEGIVIYEKRKNNCLRLD